MKKKNADGYFRATFTVGKDEKGKPIRITVRSKDSKEFERKLNAAKRRYLYGYALEDITVYDWAERWLAVYKKNLSASQQEHYKAKLTNDILPYIGSMLMRNVRASHLQNILNEYSGGKVGTVRKIKIALKQLFDAAELEGIIERNPAARLELPQLTENNRRPLNEIERAIVFHVATYHKAGLYVLIMLFCGLRRGECIALTAADVDFERMRICVNKSLSLRKNVGVEKDTKSKAGLREVPIPDILLTRLEELCANKAPEEILFPYNDGQHLTRQACVWLWRSFKRECHIKAGAEVYRNQIKIETSVFDDNITPHYLRHTYATDLYAAGVDDKAQKTFLGHSSKDVTDIYRKMNETTFKRATALINEYYLTLNFDLFSEEIKEQIKARKMQF